MKNRDEKMMQISRWPSKNKNQVKKNYTTLKHRKNGHKNCGPH